MVPSNPTSYGRAPMDQAWSTPTLREFSSATWADLSVAEQRRIARHFAYAPAMPPDTFSDLSLPHHRAEGADVVWRGVVAAAGRLDQTALPSDQVADVRAHLANHYEQFDRVAPWKRSADRWREFCRARDARGTTWRDDALAALFRAHGFDLEAIALEDHTMDTRKPDSASRGARTELRHVARPVEARTDDTGAATRLSGYAAVFDTPATIGGLQPFVEVIDRGAFDQALGDDVRVLFNHDPNLLIGRTKSGTASISIDQHGLRYDVTPPDTQVGRDVLALVARGDVDGSSFGFRVLEDTWTEGVTADDLPVRHVQRVSLYDVSPVTAPAYTETSVEARAEAETITAAVVARREAKRDALAETERRRRRVAENIATSY